MKMTTPAQMPEHDFESLSRICVMVMLRCEADRLNAWGCEKHHMTTMCCKITPRYLSRVDHHGGQSKTIKFILIQEGQKTDAVDIS